jgi:hypothetical protein
MSPSFSYKSSVSRLINQVQQSNLSNIKMAKKISKFLNDQLDYVSTFRGEYEADPIELSRLVNYISVMICNDFDTDCYVFSPNRGKQYLYCQY